MFASERSERSRNFLGALFGGALGILFCAYVNAWNYPIGVVIGVIGGYWYDQLWKGIKTGYVQATAIGQTVKVRFTATVAAAKNKLRGSTFESVHVRNTRRAKQGVSGAMAIVTLLHLALVAFLDFCCYRALAGAHPEPKDFESNIGRTALLGIVFVIVFGALTLLGVCVGKEMAEERVGKFGLGNEWEESPARFVLRRIGLALYAELSGIFCVVTAALFWAGLGGVFVAVVVVPISAFILIAKSVYLTLRLGGHGLCLMVTLIVTGIAALVFRPVFGNHVAVAAVSLLAGLVSAVWTDVLLRQMQHTEWWRKFVSEPSPTLAVLASKWLTPAKEYFMEIWDERMVEGIYRRTPLFARNN